MLAGGERLPRDGRMHRGRRQVEDDVDRGIGDELVDRRRLESVLRRELPGGRRVDVRAGRHLEGVERGGVLDVVVADHTAADDPDGRGPVHAASSSISSSATSERRAASSSGPSVSSCSTSSHSTPARTAAGATRS